jgi:small-conductance mechanosensitive channel
MERTRRGRDGWIGSPARLLVIVTLVVTAGVWTATWAEPAGAQGTPGDDVAPMPAEGADEAAVPPAGVDPEPEPGPAGEPDDAASADPESAAGADAGPAGDAEPQQPPATDRTAGSEPQTLKADRLAAEVDRLSAEVGTERERATRLAHRVNDLMEMNLRLVALLAPTGEPAGTPLPASPDEAGPVAAGPPEPAAERGENWAAHTFLRSQFIMPPFFWGLIAFVVGVFGAMFVRGRLHAYALAMAQRTPSLIDDAAVGALRNVLFWGLLIGGAFGFLYALLDYWLITTPDVAQTVGAIVATIVVVIAAFGLIDVLGAIILALARRTETLLDDHLAKLAIAVFKPLALLGGLLVIIDVLTGQAEIVAAAAGLILLGAVVFGFDALRNLVAGVQILATNPFGPGDLIILGDDEQVGIVRRQGLVTTGLETPDRTLLTVPNRVLARAAVENVSRRESRRHSFTLPLAPDTAPGLVDTLVDEIDEMLLGQEDVVTRGPALDETGRKLFDETGEPVITGVDPVVALERVAADGLHLRLQYDLKPMPYDEAAAAQHAILLWVLERCDHHGVAVATAKPEAPEVTVEVPAAATSRRKSGSSPKKSGGKKAGAKKGKSAGGSGGSKRSRSRSAAKSAETAKGKGGGDGKDPEAADAG